MLRLLADCGFRNILTSEVGTLFCAVSSQRIMMYLIHLIDADNSSKWRAFWHRPYNSIVYIDKIKWVGCQTFNCISCQRKPVKEKNCLRETT